MRKYSGLTLIATGALHNVVGFIMGWGILMKIHDDGWYNSIDKGGIQFDRSAIVWFLMFGFCLMIIGYLVHVWINRTNLTLPSSIGWSLLLVAIGVIILMPASGAWLMLPQAYWLITDRKRQEA